MQQLLILLVGAGVRPLPQFVVAQLLSALVVFVLQPDLGLAADLLLVAFLTLLAHGALTALFLLLAVACAESLLA